jgi:thiamine monophosphate kinase
VIDDSVDIEKTWLNKGFHTYPGNLPPGRLAIKAELESIDSFDLPKISQSKYSKQQGTKAPYIEKSGEEYKLCFPGFEYKTKSIRFIGELEITLTQQTSGTEKYHKTLYNFATVDVGKN